ncbi:MAG: glycoside hydrolase family 88 protein [Lachnospiraceae bacterium]|nr:glycoside hydrolase family 88 protein [Lachnospiraceae bacterium]
MKEIIMKNKEWIDSTWEKIDKKLSKTAVKSRNKLPYTTINGVHDDKKEVEVDWWTNGFWGGLMWLMYQETGNEEYRKTAERSEELLDEALKVYKKLHHDVGFMWHLTSGANYRITGNEPSCTRNLLAAASLFSRYNISGDYIRAWNEPMGEIDSAGFSIIDCLMNLSLLYWASEEIGDDRYKKIAMRHMDMTLREHIRQDGSVNHIVNHEVDKVGVQNILAGQGYSQTSCWSRGLAWAVYGSIISYIHAGKAEYLEAAKKTADYFIEHCKKTDYLPVIDFMAPETPVYYDSTAGVCAACGMLEIAKCVSEEEGKRYTEEAIHILKACDQHFCNYEEDEDALVLMGSERYPSLEEYKRGVHIPIIYGDFFFVEAMLKLKGNDFFIW